MIQRKEGAKAMLRELDKEGGMQRQSSVCLTGDDPSRTATARGVSCSSAPVTDSLGPRPGHTLKGGGHDGAIVCGRPFVGFRSYRRPDGSFLPCASHLFHRP